MALTPIKVFIGYDSREVMAYHVLSQSILRHASVPVSITPIVRSQVHAIHKRPRGPLESTEFSMTRFLTPYLAEYKGWAIFMDCDMLCRADIAELYDLKDNGCDVMCVQHEYEPSTQRKMLDQQQTVYEKKNWSSLMMFNASRCTRLTPEYVNRASGLELHQFKWVRNEICIGALNPEWNWLVGEYDYNPDARLVHFTLGGPWWSDYVAADYADEWRDEAAQLVSP